MPIRQATFSIRALEVTFCKFAIFSSLEVSYQVQPMFKKRIHKDRNNRMWDSRRCILRLPIIEDHYELTCIPKMHTLMSKCPVPHNVTAFGYKAFREMIKVKWDCMAGPYKKKGRQNVEREDHVKTQREESDQLCKEGDLRPRILVLLTFSSWIFSLQTVWK